MNDAERGIAAYRATAQKLGKSKKRRKKAQPVDDPDVSVAISSADGAGNEDTSPGGEKKATPGHAPGGREDNLLAGKKGRLNAEKRARAEAANRGYRKVAKFLLLLGKEEAAKILQHFDKDEIEAITLEIAQVGRIDKVEADQLLSEFGVAGAGRRSVHAGPDTAKAMLSAAFGEERAQHILGRAVPESRERPFQFLDDIGHEQLSLLMKNETTPTISLILPHIAPQKASKVLQALPSDRQREIIRRIANMKRVDPEVIVRIEAVLKERIRTQGRVITEEIDGREALANILKYLDYSQEEAILDDLESIDPELSQDVKERLFTIDLVFNIEDADLQAILRDYDDEEIAVILKAKDDRVQERILSNLSSRRQAMIRDELARLGKMRKSEVDSATKDFVDYLVDLDDQHKITIRWKDGIVE